MAKNAGSFQKGKSGNPGGRSKRVGPNGETVAQMARIRTREMLTVLEEIALDKTIDPKERITAANSVLARGWGAVKPAADDGDGEGRIDLGQALLELINRLPA